MGKSAYFFLIIFLLCSTLFAQLDCKISSNSNIVVQPVVEQKTLNFKFFSVSKGSLIKELKINNLKASQVKSYLINDNANILCIPARFTSIPQALKMVETFLNTDFEGGRHQKRVAKIKCM